MQVTFTNSYHRRSTPPGVDIVADEVGISLVIGGNAILGMSLQHDPPMFMPDVAHTFATPQGPRNERISVATARLHLTTVSILSSTGEKVDMGPELKAAFEHHEAAWKKARAPKCPPHDFNEEPGGVCLRCGVQAWPTSQEPPKALVDMMRAAKRVPS